MENQVAIEKYLIYVKENLGVQSFGVSSELLEALGNGDSSGTSDSLKTTVGQSTAAQSTAAQSTPSIDVPVSAASASWLQGDISKASHSSLTTRSVAHEAMLGAVEKTFKPSQTYNLIFLRINDGMPPLDNNPEALGLFKKLRKAIGFSEITAPWVECSLNDWQQTVRELRSQSRHILIMMDEMIHAGTPALGSEANSDSLSADLKSHQNSNSNQNPTPHSSPNPNPSPDPNLSLSLTLTLTLETLWVIPDPILIFANEELKRPVWELLKAWKSSF